MKFNEEDTSRVLVVNCGSSSIKYQLYEMPGGTVLAKGLVECIGQQNGALVDVTPVRLPKTEPYFAEVEAFVEAIRTNGTSPVPGEEGLIATRILDAIYRSGRTGKEAKV